MIIDETTGRVGFPENPLPPELRTYDWDPTRLTIDGRLFGFAASLLDATLEMKATWATNKVYGGWTFDEAVEILQRAKEAAERRLNELLEMPDEKKPLSERFDERTDP